MQRMAHATSESTSPPAVEARCLKLPLCWQWLESVRQEVSKALAAHQVELREAAVLVATELAENVIKFGEPLSEESRGEFSVWVAKAEVAIVTQNRVTSTERAAALIATLEEIRTAPDPARLFLRRMQMLLDRPQDSGSRLGLYRVAYAGGFQLNWEYESGVMTVTATRSLAS